MRLRSHAIPLASAALLVGCVTALEVDWGAGPTPTPPVGSAPILESWERVGTGGVAATSISVPRPAGTVQGDLLLLLVSVDAVDATLTLPAGFIEIADGGFAHLAVGFAFAGVAEPASYVVTWGFDEDAIVHLLRFSRVDPANPVVIGTRSAGSSTTDIVFKDLTTSGSESFVLAVASHLASGGFEGGSGWSTFTPIDLYDNAFANQVILGSSTFAATGTSVTESFTGGSPIAYNSFLVEIRATP